MSKTKSKINIAMFFAKWQYHLLALFSVILSLVIVFTIWFDKALYLTLIVYIPLAIFDIYSFMPLIRYYWYKARVILHETSIKTSKYVITRNGNPGSGKTSSLIYDAVVLAKKMWITLKFQYWFGIGMEKRLLASANVNKINAWQKVKEAYEFYCNNDCVPCLMTNIPVLVDGKFTCVLTRKHIEQIERIPEYTVLFFDEIGSEISIDETRKTRPLSIGQFARWCRHFGEFHIYCTEQDKNNVNKDIRRCVCENRYMLEQVPVLKPIFWSWIFNKLKLYFVKRMSVKQSKLFSSFMLSLDNFIKYSGFRKYYYKDFAGTEAGFQSMLDYSEENINSKQIRKRAETFILPAMLNCSYNDRCYRNFYKAKEKPLIKKVWNSLIISPSDVGFKN